MKGVLSRILGVTVVAALFYVFLYLPMLEFSKLDSHTNVGIGVTPLQPIYTVTPSPHASDTKNVTVTPYKTVQVTAIKALHLRSGSGVTFGVTTSLLSGTRVDVIGKCEAGWVEISADGTEGWVNADYLSGEVCQ